MREDPNTPRGWILRLWHVTPFLNRDPMNPGRGPLIERGQMLRLAQTARPSGHGAALAVKTYSSDLRVGYIPNEFRWKIISRLPRYFAHVTAYEFSNDGFCRVRLRFYRRATAQENALRFPYAD